jgi:acyl carrier protein
MDIADENTVREKVREILLRAAPRQMDMLSRESNLVADLAYHSLAIMEAIFALEEEIGVEFADYGEAGEITTVGDVEDYVLKIVPHTRSL